MVEEVGLFSKLTWLWWRGRRGQAFTRVAFNRRFPFPFSSSER